MNLATIIKEEVERMFKEFGFCDTDYEKEVFTAAMTRVATVVGEEIVPDAARWSKDAGRNEIQDRIGFNRCRQQILTATKQFMGDDKTNV